MFGFTIYGSLAISRLFFQIFTSIFERKKSYIRRRYPMATLIVPVYNEDLEVLEPAFRSFKRQSYRRLEIIVVDDGSKNHKNVKALASSFGFRYIYQKNAGKREAMYNAFNKMHPETGIVFTADSDTIWDRHAARNLARTLLDDKNTGAVTGEVAVLNHSQNWLTKLIEMRYHIAFAHERASQSLFGTVTCVSGPLGAYRRDIIDEIKESFISQTFRGKICTYGDDRHLTNLVLNQGKKVRYSDSAIAWTTAPEKLAVLVKQQTRWSKSYWREIMWQTRVLKKHGFYLTYDWLITVILPFVLVLAALSHIATHSDNIIVSLMVLVQTIALMSILRIIEPIYRTKRLVYLIFISYSFIYFFIMLPIKFYALATMNDVKWGTR